MMRPAHAPGAPHRFFITYFSLSAWHPKFWSRIFIFNGVWNGVKTPTMRVGSVECGMAGAFGGFILDKIAETGILSIAHRRLERNGLLGHLQDGANAGNGKLHFIGDFFGDRFAAEILEQPLLQAHELVDGLDHVHRDAD